MLHAHFLHLSLACNVGESMDLSCTTCFGADNRHSSLWSLHPHNMCSAPFLAVNATIVKYIVFGDCQTEHHNVSPLSLWHVLDLYSPYEHHLLLTCCSPEVHTASSDLLHVHLALGDTCFNKCYHRQIQSKILSHVVLGAADLGSGQLDHESCGLFSRLVLQSPSLPAPRFSALVDDFGQLARGAGTPDLLLAYDL